jgi:DNA-binding response OmpR family regulator
MPKILLAEDDIELAGVVKDWLTREFHVVEWVDDGKDALESLKYYEYDVVVLDWNLPGVTGVEIAKQFRARGGTTPILMLTGRTMVKEKEEGFDTGADDYLTKPFDPRELSARLKALLRRPKGVLSNSLKFGDLELDPRSRRVVRGGNEVQLGPKEFALLEFFMRHPSEVFTSDALLERVWLNESDSSSDTVRVHINRLRNKIDTDGTESLIRTVFKQGYRFHPPV